MIDTMTCCTALDTEDPARDILGFQTMSTGPWRSWSSLGGVGRTLHVLLGPLLHLLSNLGE